MAVNTHVTSRLWPMLLVLVLLLTGALALEMLARARGGEVQHIVIGAPATGLGDEEGDDDGPILGSSAPLDEAHAQARRDCQRGALDKGIQGLRAVVSRHPARVELRRELGFWLLRAHHAQAARSELEAALQASPGDAVTLLYLGRVHVRLGDLAAAEQAFREALASAPGFGSAQLALGTTLRKLERLDEAIEVLRGATAAGSNEERARAQVELGSALLIARREEPAHLAFDRAVELAPARAEIRVGIARALLEVGGAAALTEARSVLAQAQLLAPDLALVFSTLGTLHERQHDDDAAVDAYQRALRLDPSLRYPRRRLLRLALDQRDFKRARSQAEQLLGDAPDEPEHHFLLGLVASREGSLDEARAAYRRATELAGGSYPEAAFNLGKLERGAGQLDAAIAAYRAALEQRPGYREAANNLGLALAAAGHPEDAIASYRALLEREPRYLAAWINLGKILSGRGAYDDAVQAFERALAIQADHPRALLDLGVTYTRMGQRDRALASYRTLTEQHPRYVAAWHNLALSQDATGQRDQAVASLQRALAIDPEHLPSRRALARVLEERGQLEDAQAQLEELLDHRPGDGDARLALARVLRGRGQPEACLRATEGSLVSRPDDRALRALHDDCAREAQAAVQAP